MIVQHNLQIVQANEMSLTGTFQCIFKIFKIIHFIVIDYLLQKRSRLSIL